MKQNLTGDTARVSGGAVCETDEITLEELTAAIERARAVLGEMDSLAARLRARLAGGEAATDGASAPGTPLDAWESVLELRRTFEELTAPALRRAGEALRRGAAGAGAPGDLAARGRSPLGRLVAPVTTARPGVRAGGARGVAQAAIAALEASRRAGRTKE